MERGTIIQITDETHAWFPALLIVDEVKSWGVQAYCLTPHSNMDHDVRSAFNRLTHGQFEVVGKASIVNE